MSCSLSRTGTWFLAVFIVLVAAIACRQPGTGVLEERNRLQTYTPEDWDYWQVFLEGEEGQFRTYTPEDWDYWNYTLAGESGFIRTYTPEDWDYWQIDNGNYTLRTDRPGDWDYWVLSGNGRSIILRTNTPSDWDYWQLSGDATGLLRAYTPNDFDNWEVEVNWGNLTPDVKAAVLFIPILVGSLKEQGVCCQ